VREQYETQADLSNEQEVADVLSDAWKIDLHKLPISYRLDFFVTKEGKGKAVVEVKSRNNTHDKYPTLMLSLSKWNHGIDFALCNKLAFVIAAKYTDGVFYYKYSDKDEFSIEWGGRTVHTRDSADIEPVVHIPINKLKRVVS